MNINNIVRSEKKFFSERNDMFLGKGRRLNKFPGDDLKEKKQSKCRDI